MKQSTIDTKLKLSKVANAPKRFKAIMRGVLDGLGIKHPNELQTLLATRIAELTLASEELSTQFLSGRPVSVEVMGRNADRIQRTMTELRRHAPPRVWNMSLGLFQEKDRHALRTMSVNTLEELIRTLNLPQQPTVRGSVFRLAVRTPDDFIPDDEIARDMATLGRR
jgi:hypothetical protein